MIDQTNLIQPNNSVNTSFAKALYEAEALLGKSRVLHNQTDLYQYAASLSGYQKWPALVVKPHHKDTVTALIGIARKYNLPIHPISRGKNFGYGMAQGTSSGHMVLDMSDVDQILDVDANLGYITIEPGVSQQKLFTYLESHCPSLQMDVTGAGKDSSVMGNVLERGFGHTDYGDRFNSILNMVVALPNGQVIRTGFGDFPNARAAKTYRHGIGPSVDGLFTQANFGVVLEMTIALQRKPKCMEMFACLAPTATNLGQAVEAIRQLKMDGVLNSAVHIANRERLAKPGETNSKMGHWNVSGTVTGPKSIVKAKRKVITAALRRKVTQSRVIWINTLRLKLLQWFHQNIKPLRVYLDLREAMGLKMGIPTEAYVRDLMNNPNASSKTIGESALTQCFKWISAVCPATPEDATEMVRITQHFLESRGYRFRVTLTFINERSLIMISEINYPPDAKAQAEIDYKACVKSLANAGYYAYRSGPGSYDTVIPNNTPLYQMLAKIKACLDPQGLISPGKYTL